MNVLVNAQLYGVSRVEGWGSGVGAAERVKVGESLYAACPLIWRLFTGVLALLPPRTLLRRPVSEPSFAPLEVRLGTIVLPIVRLMSHWRVVCACVCVWGRSVCSFQLKPVN